MKINVLQYLGTSSDMRPAWVFSTKPVDSEIADQLRESQAIIEAQWLINYNWMPCCVVWLPQELRDLGTQLFGRTCLLNKEYWDLAIDQAEIVLINDEMYKMLGYAHGEDNFLNHGFFNGITAFTALNLTELFQHRMFVVAGVY